MNIYGHYNNLNEDLLYLNFSNAVSLVYGMWYINDLACYNKF